MPNFLAVSSEKTKMSGHRDTCSETWNAEYLKKGVIGYTILVPDVPDSGATKLVRRTIRRALVVYLKDLLAYIETIVVMI